MVRRLQHPANEPDMSGPQTKPVIVETRLGPVECASYGEGAAVIALHGGMGGCDQSLLLAQSAIAAPGFRILAVSRPGYLGTPLSSGRSPEQQADLCAALLDTLGIARAAVIAVSAGGPCALQFALRHADRCWAMVTVSICTGHLDTPRKVSRSLAIMRVAVRIPFMERAISRRMAGTPEEAAHRSIADAELCARTLAHPDAGPLLVSLLTSTFDRMAQRLPGTVNDTALFRLIDAYPLAQIAVPVLAIHGTGDRVVPFAHGEALAKTVPGAEFLAIEGGEHVSLFTHLEEVRARVGAFLFQHNPAG
jgi:pimeloyl-ACP methyl ester carboxylesterase